MKKETTPRFFELLKNGEPSAYYHLIEQYSQHLMDFLVIVLRCREDAEEIAQDIFIHIWNKRQTLVFDNMQGIKGYIFTLARTRAIDRINERKRSRLNYTDHLVATPVNSDTPEEILQSRQLEGQIETVTSEMPRMRRTIYLMRFNHGKSNEEIAKELKLKPSTVRAHISIALKEIKQFIGTLLTF